MRDVAGGGQRTRGTRGVFHIAGVDGIGPSPNLPEPNRTLIPTVNIASAVGWPAGGKPKGAQGAQVAAFAENLDHPRWLYVLPNGDVRVTETNAPPKPDDSKGIKGWVMKKVMGLESNHRRTVDGGQRAG